MIFVGFEISKQDYPELLKISSDPLPERFISWKLQMEKLMGRATRGDWIFHEGVEVKPESLVYWCESNGRPIDRDSRKAYIREVFIQRERIQPDWSVYNKITPLSL
ncbi:hypothetical protein [Sinorhizobium americanum]|uniref:hypothetical protein n=1 Tax=Sinorhizobium americanum TaxID=194963 RepID=UPI0007D8EDC5|nr:hypothetical protein [Sinorhizobium americanum]OAP43741.1 hypothetical protein ATC00_02555 [Sinorhizobium americanum]